MIEEIAVTHSADTGLSLKALFYVLDAAFHGRFGAANRVHNPLNDRDHPDDGQDEDDEEEPQGRVGEVYQGLFHDLPLQCGYCGETVMSPLIVERFMEALPLPRR
ncbi:MAG TPA: hypothetical protein VFL13_14145, partial [Candidatus Baltobacteraceae bacterium]|nr:hypothetical protein [Candidatus Baltobacteraceae bacterium]